MGTPEPASVRDPGMRAAPFIGSKPRSAKLPGVERSLNSSTQTSWQKMVGLRPRSEETPPRWLWGGGSDKAWPSVLRRQSRRVQAWDGNA